MRGDGANFAGKDVYLAESESLKGVPVFSTSGERLGTLGSVVVHGRSDSIASVVLDRPRLFGLLRRRVLLSREVLRAPVVGGGFVVPWPLPKPVPGSVLRLDPARGE